MRITKVSVQGLFRLFDHEIPLNDSERITIVIGPNGIGKTILFRMLDSVFSRQRTILRSVPYKQFRIDFDDESYLVIEREPQDSTRLIFNYHARGKKWHLIDAISPREEQYLGDAVSHFVDDLARVGPDRWRYLPTGEIMNLYEVLDRFRDEIPDHFRSDIPENPEWYRDLTASVKVRFVNTERLWFRSRRRERREQSLVEAVDAFSEELAEKIKTVNSEYTKVSQSLDRTFPQRLVESIEKQDAVPNESEISRQLSELEGRRVHLSTLGLLEPEKEDQGLLPVRASDEFARRVLMVYLADAKQRLDAFDELAEKIHFLKDVVSRRFRHKSIAISKTGFSFETGNREALASSALSSGEKHQLVMLFELLLRAPQDSLILIDEPEISLHVGWQHQFIRDLQAIAKMTRCDFLVATHSPQIIHNRWDLAVELGSVDDE